VVRKMLYVGGLVSDILFGAFYRLPREAFAWLNFACEVIALREGLMWLVTLHYRRKHFLSLLTILRFTDVTDVSRIISICIINQSINIFYCRQHGP